jgi:asparagine synthase (glutamine-hydrolysing)
MCGIGGIVSLGGALPTTEQLAKLGGALAHRGPDGEGTWVSRDGRIGLIHRRLAILDRSPAGSQPMMSRDGRYVISYNGEIYNFLELKQELEEAGFSFHTESDTEVILAAWRAWGERAFLRMNGMWALAIADVLSGEVILCRDRFGIKPLLYAVVANQALFASEVRALTPLLGSRSNVDMGMVAKLLFDPFSVEATDRTLFASIHRLPAGHLAVVSGQGVSIRRWWRTLENLPNVPDTFEDQADHFRELFLDSVRLRMRSDVSIATCLSGGFDSAAIVGAMRSVSQSNSFDHKRAASDWRHAFIASFPGMSNDETPDALAAASFAHVKPHLVRVDNDSALAQIQRVLEDLDDVYISLPTATWLTYESLRASSIVVSVDGHGADELMGGYRQEGDDLAFFARNALARLSSKPALPWVLEASKRSWLRLKRQLFLRDDPISASHSVTSPFDSDELPTYWSGLNRRLYRMFHIDVLPTILRNFDRLSMAHGIEVRMPFMDWRLVTYVMALPVSAKSKAGRSKYIARESLKGLLPESIRTAKRKIGFNSPMPEWLNGPLVSWTEAILAERVPAFEELVDEQALRAEWKRLSSHAEWSWQTVGRLWPYLNMKWYLKRYAS